MRDVKAIAHMFSFSAFVMLLIVWVITSPAFQLGDLLAWRPRRIARRQIRHWASLPRISQMGAN